MKRKLIEVALPLEAINNACKPETENPFLRRHPRALHIYWARIPLVACRAVILSSLLDDPSGDAGLTEEEQDEERARLLDLVTRVSTWEASSAPALLEEARSEICRHLGDDDLPPIVDPFSGRGSICLEAARLGLPARASDLNPVAVLITSGLLDYPARFRDSGSVHPATRDGQLPVGAPTGVGGLLRDIELYAGDVAAKAKEQLASIYPAASNGRDPLAWLWARTVTCPNPACRATVPMIRSFAVSSKGATKVWLEPHLDNGSKTVSFDVRRGNGPIPAATKVGSRQARFRCLFCQTIADEAYIRSEGVAGRIGEQLLTTVTSPGRGREYLKARNEDVAPLESLAPISAIDSDLPKKALGFRVQIYGMTKHSDLFTKRQLRSLAALTDLVNETRDQIEIDAIAAGLPNDAIRLADGGRGAAAYADALVVYLTCAISRLADYANNLATWNDVNQNISHLFQRQAVPMVWDFAESNIITGSQLNLASGAQWVIDALANVPVDREVRVSQRDAARTMPTDERSVVVTDPPYYDNIGYGDLADFFYVWLRRTLGGVLPDLFSTILSPKAAELVATPYRFDGSSLKAKEHFLKGLEASFARARAIQHPDYPMCVFYAFKQEEADEDGTASTGWETMLEGLLESGFLITGTWPVRTTKAARSVARGTSALASAIVLVCRPRPDDAGLGTRKGFVQALRDEMPDALRKLQHGNIAPVDLAQAAIGPGMAVFSRHTRVVEASGEPMSVRSALGLINEVLDEVLASEEGELDPETRWAITWFAQHGFNPGDGGDANLLCNARNTALNALIESGIVTSKGGQVRLLVREELPPDWDPLTDRRLTVWEVVQHLIRVLESDGEVEAARLLRRCGDVGELARVLAYRLYTICQRSGWNSEAAALNGLVVAWPELQRLGSHEAQRPLGI